MGIEIVAEEARYSCLENDDDALYLVVGPTGSGKSTLALHLHQVFMKEEASVDYIGLNRDSFAEAYGNALKRVKEKKPLRICVWDEANISRRDALSKFNKQLINIYMKNRALRMLHIWCNPSVQMIDNIFIKERIKGFFYCPSKEKTVRPYYYIPKEGLLKIYDKYKSIDEPTIKKTVKEYALFKGWYREYKGPMKEEYLKKKLKETEESSEEWVETWRNTNTGLLETQKVLNKTGISYNTLRNYIERGNLIEGKDYEVSATGVRKYYPTVLETIKEVAKQNYINMTKGFKNAHPS